MTGGSWGKCAGKQSKRANAMRGVLVGQLVVGRRLA